MHLEYLSSATNDTKIGAHAHCVGYSEEILNPPHGEAKYHSILKRSYLSVRGDTDACTIDSFPRKINSTKISSAQAPSYRTRTRKVREYYIRYVWMKSAFVYDYRTMRSLRNLLDLCWGS